LKPATIILHREFTIGEIDNRLYGTFIEHLGRVFMEDSTSRITHLLMATVFDEMYSIWYGN
jgi:alpha-L-arabinofuranosidase